MMSTMTTSWISMKHWKGLLANFMAKSKNNFVFYVLSREYHSNISRLFDNNSLSLMDRHIRKHFVIMDYNNDGSISLSEFNKMHLIYADM